MHKKHIEVTGPLLASNALEFHSRSIKLPVLGGFREIQRRNYSDFLNRNPSKAYYLFRGNIYLTRSWKS